MDKPLPVDKLLRTGSVHTLVARVETLRALDGAVRAALQESFGHLAAGVRATDCQAGTLTLIAANAALATRVRMAQPAVLAALRASGARLEPVRSIQVRVAGVPAPPPVPARTAVGPRAPRPQAARALRLAATSLQNGELADAVRRLAAHLGDDTT